jgi:hypothetical protein
VASKAQNHVFVLLERMLAIDEQHFVRIIQTACR